ncbi:MAG: nucleotidyl transferase AbiEii/AbiGii toxin family protein [bacterium]|nr:nucleotidyl transferase AbiEii/AbiGii toxin family protein [bacterium]
MKPPSNVAFLERAIRRLAASNEEAVQMRVTMANVVAGQFLDGVVMRGGGSLKLRYGEETTRYTTDFDAARNIDEEEFIERFNARVAKGWNDFAGRLVKKPKPRPRQISPKYVMQPFEVKLTYRNHPWCTVDLEVSYNEVGDADAFDTVALPESILKLFSDLNLPRPNPVPLMKISHQLAQKIHGATDVRFVRVQDLVDLQLMVSHETVALREVREICERLFANRRLQPWPSRVIPTQEWSAAYEAARADLPVLPTVDEAVAWANDLIARIDAAKGDSPS